MTANYAARARALVGTRFRPQGRGEEGLDCVGVVIASYQIPADAVRGDYALRGDRLNEARRALEAPFRRIPRSQLRPGDLMLLQTGESQLHFAVRTDRGFVHAHAGIRRVVETPGLPEWPLLGAYRRRRGH